MSDQTPDDLKMKSQQKAAWNDTAEGWKRWWPTFERAAQIVNDRLVELAGVRAGSRVLDIATGSGEPALTAARAVGQSGRVVAVDMSPEMLAIARERIDAAGLRNVELVESDAEALKLDANSFDAALCRWGLMFMPDLDGLVRGLHRALKPDGRFATAVWSVADKVPMCGLARDAIRRITGIVPPPNAPDPTRRGPLDPRARAGRSRLSRCNHRTPDRNVRISVAGRIRGLPRPDRRHPRDARENARRRRPPGARRSRNRGTRIRNARRRRAAQQRDHLLRRARITGCHDDRRNPDGLKMKPAGELVLRGLCEPSLLKAQGRAKLNHLVRSLRSLGGDAGLVKMKAEINDAPASGLGSPGPNGFSSPNRPRARAFVDAFREARWINPSASVSTQGCSARATSWCSSYGWY